MPPDQPPPVLHAHDSTTITANALTSPHCL
jgi:hypothetical protein